MFQLESFESGVNIATVNFDAETLRLYRTTPVHIQRNSLKCIAATIFDVARTGGPLALQGIWLQCEAPTINDVA
jgi:hypothetical protein